MIDSIARGTILAPSCQGASRTQHNAERHFVLTNLPSINSPELAMRYKDRCQFQCDECGQRYETVHDPLRVAREELEFHVGVSKSHRPANYCRPCLADKLRLLADEISDEWPDLVMS